MLSASKACTAVHKAFKLFFKNSYVNTYNILLPLYNILKNQQTIKTENTEEIYYVH